MVPSTHNSLECLDLLKHLVHQVKRCYSGRNHEGIVHGVVVFLEELQDTKAAAAAAAATS
jgi:hypothetical protein